MRRCKAAIIGAGASGLMAACTAARTLGKGNVILLEASPKPGRKLLATGNGRCNLTNQSIEAGRYHGDPIPPQLLAAFPGARIVDEFRRLGLLTRTDPQGRVYPNSLQAAAVVRALCGACRQAGVELVCSFPAESLRPVRGGWLITAGDGREIFAQRCVLACGGKASPKLSGGAGYGLARELGHTVTPLFPSLTGLRVPEKQVKPVKGMRCRAEASLYRDGALVGRESGEVIFGERGISGICVMNLSAGMRGKEIKGVALSLDLLESFSPSQLLEYLEELCLSQPELPAGELLAGAINIRVGQEVIKRGGIPLSAPLSRLTRDQLRRTAEGVKAFRLPVSGTLGWDDAQVTAGGIPLSQVDPETMESRICPGIYITGELLNVDGDCGGYNLHWAWTTGLLAGRALAAAWKGKNT